MVRTSWHVIVSIDLLINIMKKTFLKHSFPLKTQQEKADGSISPNIGEKFLGEMKNQVKL